MASLCLQGGERVLDIGCGIGANPRDLAKAVGSNARIVGLDLLQAAIEVARRDADLPRNLSFLYSDAQSPALETGAFDAAFSRFGVMVFDEPVAALAKIRRALRAGGRPAFVCWRTFLDNELDDLPLRAASATLPAELVATAEAVGWFSFSEPGLVKDCLLPAGFVAIGIASHDLREHPQVRNAASARWRRRSRIETGRAGRTAASRCKLGCLSPDAGADRLIS